MRAVTVYRRAYGRKTRYPVGIVLEQRKTERTNNYNDLLQLARRLYSLDTVDSVRVLIDVSQALGTNLPERTTDCAAG